MRAGRLLLILLILTPVLAAEVGPDQPIAYFFDRAGESIQLFFTFNRTVKQALISEFVQERLREAELMTQLT